MENQNYPNQNYPNQNQENSQTSQQQYQEALLQSGINAANLLNELIELKLMPDPRAKEMAEVALEVIQLINSAPEEIVGFKGN